MDLKRRDFLKGLMGLAGVAVVGLPAADTELFDDIDNFLASGGEPAHAVGPYGSMRIDDKWYAVHDASVDVSHGITDVTWFGDSWKNYAIRQSSWSVDCSLKDAGDVDIFSCKPHEIEISVNGHSFNGVAYITSACVNTLWGNLVLHGLTFDGVDALMMDG